MGDRLSIVTLAGGTGSHTVLAGLKVYQSELSLTAIVGTSDSGGSSGRLRVGPGVLPPGDFRQAMVALSRDSVAMLDLLNFRFRDDPDLKGHPVGNIILTALQQQHGRNWFSAAKILFNLCGDVIPVSEQATMLYAVLEDGKGLIGEHEIDKPDPERAPIASVYYQRQVSALPEAVQAIQRADVVVLGPGDIYTSIAPILLVDGIIDALRTTRAQKLYVVNLATKLGHTRGFGAARHCREVGRYLADVAIDHVLVNSASPNQALVERYRSQGEELVVNDFEGNEPYQIHCVDLLSQEIVRPIQNDVLPRSLLRHDSALLAQAIYQIARSSV